MWSNTTLFHWAKSIEKILRKINIDTINLDKSFFIDPLNTNNAIYRDSLTLIQHFRSSHLRAYNFIKKRLCHRCFSVKFAKFLITAIL